MPDLTFESVQRPWLPASVIPSQPVLSRSPLVIFGRIRTCNSLAVSEYLLFSLALMTLALSIHFSTLSFIHGEKRDSTLSLLIIVNAVFIFIFATYGILTLEPFAVVSLNLSKIYNSTLLVVNYLVGYEQFSLVEALISCFLTLLTFSVSFPLLLQYWKNRIDASSMNIGRRRLYTLLSMSRTLLTTDAQLTLNLLILLLDGRKVMSTWQVAGVTMGAIFFGLWLLLGHLAMRYDRTRWIWLFLGICSVQEVYTAFVAAITPASVYPDHLSLTLNISLTVWQAVHVLAILVLFMMLDLYGSNVLHRSFDLDQSTVFFGSSSAGRSLENPGRSNLYSPRSNSYQGNVFSDSD